MKLFLLILTSILSIGLISWKDSTDISQNKDCIFRDILVGYVDYDNVLDSIYIEKTSEYRYDDNDGMKECFEQTERVIFIHQGFQIKFMWTHIINMMTS